MMIEAWLDKPYYVIDFLPEQVPANNSGQFFEAERFYLTEPQRSALRRRFAGILLKLNCYEALEIGTPEAARFESNPAPERLFSLVMENQSDLLVLLPAVSALITLNRDDTHMTVYNPSGTLLRRAERLAAAEGLFLWQPEQNARHETKPSSHDLRCHDDHF